MIIITYDHITWYESVIWLHQSQWYDETWEVVSGYATWQ